MMCLALFTLAHCLIVNDSRQKRMNHLPNAYLRLVILIGMDCLISPVLSFHSLYMLQEVEPHRLNILLHISLFHMGLTPQYLYQRVSVNLNFQFPRAICSNCPSCHYMLLVHVCLFLLTIFFTRDQFDHLSLAFLECNLSVYLVPSYFPLH